MSVEVPLAELPDAVARRAFAYLVTVDENARPRLLAVDVVARDGHLVMDVGRSAIRAVVANSEVSLAFPPLAGDSGHDEGSSHDDFTLLVDGTATVDADGRLSVTPAWAVFHRPAPPFTG